MRRHNYKKLVVWQKSMALAMLVYRLVAKFPKDEQFQLSSQARRSAVSIPSNIAEGAGRKTDKDFSRFLFISHGSACELDTEMTLARDFGYISEDEYMEVSDKNEEVRAMLISLEESLNV
jgi:four helix bundle protein